MKRLEGNPISNIKNRNNIKVYYYGKSSLALEADGKKYPFDGASDGVPVVHTLSFSTIEAANSRSPVFATGTLVFDVNERDEIFNALGKADWKNAYWSEEDIENLLLHPTVSELNRMLQIRDSLTIGRVHGRMTYLKNTSMHRPSEKVMALVEHRRVEIEKGIMKSTMTVNPGDAGVTKDMEENANLKAQKEALEKQLRDQEEKFASQQAEIRRVQAQMAQLLKAQKAVKAEAVPEVKAEPVVEKKPGRPKKTT